MQRPTVASRRSAAPSSPAIAALYPVVHSAGVEAATGMFRRELQFCEESLQPRTVIVDQQVLTDKRRVRATKCHHYCERIIMD